MNTSGNYLEDGGYNEDLLSGGEDEDNGLFGLGFDEELQIENDILQ
jgi:hypothetical protein